MKAFRLLEDYCTSDNQSQLQKHEMAFYHTVSEVLGFSLQEQKLLYCIGPSFSLKGEKNPLPIQDSGFHFRWKKNPLPIQDIEDCRRVNAFWNYVLVQGKGVRTKC